MKDYEIFAFILVAFSSLFAGMFMYGINNLMFVPLVAEEPLDECKINDIKTKELNYTKAIATAEHKYGVCLGNLMGIVVEHDIEYVRTYDKNVVDCWKRCNL